MLLMFFITKEHNSLHILPGVKDLFSAHHLTMIHIIPSFAKIS